jgi:DNA-directed RNA polymerase specialized sigma24 family protein
LRSPELARAFGLAEPTIRRRLQRARAQLRPLLEESLDDAALDALGRSLAPQRDDE